MDVSLIKFLSAALGTLSAVSTAYFLRKHIGNVRKIEFLESVRRIDELRDLGTVELGESPEEPFHCAIIGAVGCADLTGLRGVMVKKMDDGTGRVVVVEAGNSDFELPLITSLTLPHGPHQTLAHYPYPTRSAFEAWDRALIHETENGIQVSKIISLELVQQVTNTANGGLTIGHYDKWPLLITQLTMIDTLQIWRILKGGLRELGGA